jgi:hypothetical protein
VVILSTSERETASSKEKLAVSKHCAMKEQRGREGKATRFLSSTYTRQKEVATYTVRFVPEGKSLRYPLDRRLEVHGGDETHLCSAVMEPQQPSLLPGCTDVRMLKCGQEEGGRSSATNQSKDTPR